MAQPLVKEEIHRLIDSLPDEATWEDLKYAIYVREQVVAGRQSAREEPLLTTKEAFEEFGLESER
jgi:hypothetical protein